MQLKKVFPNIEIKICLWYMLRNLENKRKQIYGDTNGMSKDKLN